MEHSIGKDILNCPADFQLSDFERKVYDEEAITEFSKIVKDHLFQELTSQKTEQRPKL